MAAVDQVGRIFATAEKEISRRAAKALTATAARTREEMKIEMAGVFDRPTPWVLNGVFYRGASVDQNRMFAQVWLKDFAFKGSPAVVNLKPQIFGGNRVQKRMEKALQRVGVLPVGMFAVPGRDAKLDAYGNMSRGQIVQIISWFQAFGQQGYSANMTDKRKATLGRDKTSRKTGKVTKGFSYFALHQAKHGLPPGIFQKLDYGGKPVIRIVMLFVRTPAYQKRLDFLGVAERTMRRHFAAYFASASSGGSSRRAA